MTLEHLLADYGAWALLVGAAVEGETVVMLGGVLVHRGVLGYASAVAAAAMGSFVADQLLFFLGRSMRHLAWVEKLARTRAFARVSALCERHPLTFVFGFRFLYGLRTVSPLAIGASAVPTRTFVLVNFAAAWTWALVFVSIGYAFGLTLQRLLGRWHPLQHLLLLAALVAGLLMVIAAIWHRRAERASAAPSAQDTGQAG